MFESLLMQVNSTIPPVIPVVQQSASESLTALITSMASLIGTIGAILGAIGIFLKQHSTNAKVDKVGDNLENVGKLSTAFAQKTTEQEKNFKTMAEVVTAISPQAKELLESQQKNLDYYKERADVAQQQLNRLLSQVDGKSQANSITDLPRESQKTTAATNS